jgi:hypothetical protein
MRVGSGLRTITTTLSRTAPQSAHRRAGSLVGSHCPPVSFFWRVARTTPPRGAHGPPYAARAAPTLTFGAGAHMGSNFGPTQIPRLRSVKVIRRCLNNIPSHPAFDLLFRFLLQGAAPPPPPLHPNSFTIKSSSNNHRRPNVTNYSRELVF